MKVVIFAIDAEVFDDELYYDKYFDCCEDKIILDFDIESKQLTIALVLEEIDVKFITGVLDHRYEVKTTVINEELFESFTYNGFYFPL